jgi:hypothetical protein
MRASSRQLARHALRAKIRVAPDLALSADLKPLTARRKEFDEPLIDQGRKFR